MYMMIYNIYNRWYFMQHVHIFVGPYLIMIYISYDPPIHCLSYYLMIDWQALPLKSNMCLFSPVHISHYDVINRRRTDMKHCVLIGPARPPFVPTPTDLGYRCFCFISHYTFTEYTANLYLLFTSSQTLGSCLLTNYGFYLYLRHSP